MSKHIWLLFSLVAFLLVYSALSTSIYMIGPNDLGSVSKLPLTFWVGMILLSYLWYLCRGSYKWQITSLVLAVSFLYIVPAVIRTPVWLSASYYPFGESVLISQSGHLVYRPNSILLSYHYWPGFLYLASVVSIVTGLPDYLLLKIFPMIIIALFGILVFLILRVKFKGSYAITGAAIFLGSFFLRHYYFGPAPIAYIFFLLALLVISWLYFSSRASVHAQAFEALFLIIVVVITFTHALTSLMLVAVVFSLYVSQRLVQKTPRPVTARPFLLTAIIVLSYNLYVASTFFKVSLQLFIDLFSGRMLPAIFVEPSRILGSFANQLSYWSYWSIVIINVAVASIATIQLLRSSRSAKRATGDGYAFFWVILLIVTGLFAFMGAYGPHEASQRAFMFGLVPLTYLCVNVLKGKQKIFLAVLVALLFLNIPAQYGGDSYTLARDTQLVGTKFFADYAPQNIVCFHEFSLYIRYYDPTKNIRFITLGSLPFTAFPNASTVNKAINNADYIILSDIQNNYYIYFLGENPLDQVNFSRFNRIYDNQGFLILKSKHNLPP